MAEQFGCPVAVLLNSISSYELSEWMAFYKIKKKEQEEEEKKAERKANQNKNKKG